MLCVCTRTLIPSDEKEFQQNINFVKEGDQLVAGEKVYKITKKKETKNYFCSIDNIISRFIRFVSERKPENKETKNLPLFDLFNFKDVDKEKINLFAVTDNNNVPTRFFINRESLIQLREVTNRYSTIKCNIKKPNLNGKLDLTWSYNEDESFADFRYTFIDENGVKVELTISGDEQSISFIINPTNNRSIKLFQALEEFDFKQDLHNYVNLFEPKYRDDIITLSNKWKEFRNKRKMSFLLGLN